MSTVPTNPWVRFVDHGLAVASEAMSESVKGDDGQGWPLGQDGHDRQLEVEPLPYDGVASVAVGTGLWLVALLVMLPFADDLKANGNLWWVATAAVGFVLGLAGLWVVVRRRNRLRSPAS
jgi:hypothetical protein